MTETTTYTVPCETSTYITTRNGTPVTETTTYRAPRETTAYVTTNNGVPFTYETTEVVELPTTVGLESTSEGLAFTSSTTQGSVPIKSSMSVEASGSQGAIQSGVGSTINSLSIIEGAGHKLNAGITGLLFMASFLLL